MALPATHQRAHACGVDGCEFRTDYKQHLERHQAHEHGIGDVEGENERRRTLKEHQARVHGIGDVEAAEVRRRKKRERAARQPILRCCVDGCEYQTKYTNDIKNHQARVHGIDQLTAVGRRRARAFRGRTLAVFHQRPVGRAPKGMDWDNTVGKWVPTIIDPAHASPPYE